MPEAPPAGEDAPKAAGAASTSDDVLTRAQAAYDRGDFGTTRRLLRELPHDHQGARTLRRRLAPDPVAVVVAIVCAVAFLVIFLSYAGH